MSKKIQVTFSDRQWKIIQKLIGIVGFSASDVVRNIVISYLLSEMSFIKEETSNKPIKKDVEKE